MNPVKAVFVLSLQEDVNDALTRPSQEAIRCEAQIKGDRNSEWSRQGCRSL